MFESKSYIYELNVLGQREKNIQIGLSHYLQKNTFYHLGFLKVF